MKERQISVAEEPPFTKQYKRMFFMADDEERAVLKAQFPRLIVREATAEEVDMLKGKTWDQMEHEELNRLLVENGYAPN